MRLINHEDIFVIDTIPEENVPSFSIDKKSSKISLVTNPSLKSATDPIKIAGIVGTIKFISDPYLIVFKSKQSVGKIRNHEIFRAAKFDVIPFKHSTHTFQQKDDEMNFLQRLQSFLEIDNFYFSPTMDITRSFQSAKKYNQENSNATSRPIFERMDQRFFWNRFVAESFIEQGFGKLIAPLMMGFIQISDNCKLENDKSFTFALISRRSIHRAGTRFNMRGIDEDGNVANFVETEQILISEQNDLVLSYVQIRGSIPLFWEQVTRLRYGPKIVMTQSSQSNKAAFKNHYDRLNEYYSGPVISVSLVNNAGHEGALTKCFEESAKDYDPTGTKCKFIGFDFHHECKGMRYDRISILTDKLATDILNMKYFQESSKSGNLSQSGSIRSNCVDNLDRTNVVQGALGRLILSEQLRDHGFINAGQSISDFPNFEFIFKDVWANNGDALAFQYTGTGALKNDFTRTGKRDFRGIMNDGINAVTRYYLNNFRDGVRQDGFELFLGNYVPDTTSSRSLNLPSPFASVSERKALTIKTLIFIGALAVITYLSFATTDSWLFKGSALLLWAVGIAIGYNVLEKFGRMFVDVPCLSVQKSKRQ